ncbi:hypothetical protein TWF106_011523 [Orbilia oligospora]|uniref:Uncharacterized protein n=1 Tax=Orbilia oligospora TaxID=2813651 RepID=A0A7C8UNL3_ORBOL|nr:hypothetical protein TWF106_011523 [Orbilia oligospora]
MKHSRTGSRSSSPPLQRSEPMNSAPRNLQSNERLMLSSDPHLSSRVQRRPQRPRQPRPSNRNVFNSLNREVPVNERLFSQAQTIAGTMEVQPNARSLREDQIDMTYALVRYLNSARNTRKGTFKTPDLSRWEATPTLSIPQGASSPYPQGQLSTLSTGPTSPTLSHQQAFVYSPDRIITYAGAQFEGEDMIVEDTEDEA